MGDDEEEEDNFLIHDAVYAWAKGKPDNHPISILQDALRSHPHSVNLLDTANLTPMHLAVYFDAVDVVSLLLAWGGDPIIQGSRGRSVLLLAICIEAHKCAKLLIQQGVDLNACTTHGPSCLDYRVGGKTVPLELTQLLIVQGANLTSSQGNPLHWLASCCSANNPVANSLAAQKTRLLLDAGLHV